MNAEAVRRLLADADIIRVVEADDSDELLSALRAAVDRLADRERLFEAGRLERERIARLAVSLLDDERSEDDVETRLLHARGDWRERAAASEELLKRGVWTPVRVLGSFAPASVPRVPPQTHDRADAAVAKALILALREVLTPEAEVRQEALRRENGGVSIWEKKLHALLGHFAGNARAHGDSREGAALRTLAAAVVLKGEELCAHDQHRSIALALGAAASSLVRSEPSEPKKETSALTALKNAVQEQNGVRLGLWDGYDAEAVRRFGAAAAGAVTGRGSSAPYVPQQQAASTVAFRLPERWHERFSHVAASDAADALERHANDPRSAEAERLMAEALAETLRAHPDAETVSFSEALGIESAELRTDAFRPGDALLRAAPHGKRPAAILCYGKRGRALRCRAVTNTDGALVGYRAFDPLSRELGGKAVYALYDLAGQRCGYAWADAQSIVRSGSPAQGFVTAPESIIFE
ncbi:MAG: hypothetical protein WC866_05365 [Patescibacteria group bacterium]|jgi:hypothetical protein